MSSPHFQASQYLSEDLKYSSNPNLNIEGSLGAPLAAQYLVPGGRTLALTRIMITIEDGVVEFSPGDFAALAALTNGIEFSTIDSQAAKTPLELWKTNREVRSTMFDFDHEFKTAGAYTGRWTIQKDSGGLPLILPAGSKVQALIQDDLRAITWLSFRIKGRLV